MIKKILGIFLGLFVLDFSLQAGIIGASRWQKDEKIVVVYFDDHEAGSVEERLTHFNYLLHSVIETSVARLTPLTLLVENYVREPAYRALVHSCETFTGDNQRFLQLFDGLASEEPHGMVCIKSIDARGVPFLSYAIICEWLKRFRGHSSLPDELYSSLDDAFKSITFDQVFSLALAIDRYIEHAPCEISHEIFSEQKAVMFDFIYTVRAILLHGGFTDDEIKHQPIKDIAKKIATGSISVAKRTAWFQVFCDYRGQDFWPCDLLWQLTNANALWEILHTPGTVALFTGSHHAVNIEDALVRLGYVQTGSAQKAQVESKRRFVNGLEAYSDAPMHLISTKSFDWIV